MRSDHSTSNQAAPRSAEAELRVGIAGAGKMAGQHAIAISRTASGRVVALAEPDAAARESFSERFSDAASFASLEALLDAADVDVVHVCTPPHTHEELALAVLRSDTHVYVEKPFAQTRDGAQRVLACAEERGLRVCAGHQLLFEPPSRRALELQPALGPIHHMESYFSFRPVRTGAGGTKPLRMDLQLLDVLPHPVYSLLHFLEIAAPREETRMTRCELGPGGTVHALLRHGELTANLVVTLEGRPVESYLKLVGQNGSLHADFVRGTVQQLIGPGASFIDKSLNPYRLSGQLLSGTTKSLGNRVLQRRASYPGLVEIFEAFYRSIRGATPAPISHRNIVETVTVCQQVAEAIEQALPSARPGNRSSDGDGASEGAPAPSVLITGGTGFLGEELVRIAAEGGLGVRVLARREPAPWARVPHVDYRVADLGAGIPEGAMRGIDTVVHLAAETGGGFDEHARNSVAATEFVCRAAEAAGVRKLIHVSSLAVYDAQGGQPIREDSPLEAHPRERGPYVWGKVESERVVSRAAAEAGIRVAIVRPGAIIDLQSFDPPGRLGRRLGGLFVAVGSAGDRLGVVHRSDAARVLVWMIRNFDRTPPVINLLQPELPRKSELVDRLRAANPGLRVLWLPNAVLKPLSRAAVLAQRLLRRDQNPVDMAKVFAVDPYDTTQISELHQRMEPEQRP